MRSILLVAFITLLSLAAPVGASARPGHSELVDRMLAIQSPCQARRMVLGVYADIAREREVMPLRRKRAAQRSFRIMLWQNHMLYVYAHVAGHGDLSGWLIDGTVLLAPVANGEQTPDDGREQWQEWQARYQPLLARTEVDCRQEHERCLTLEARQLKDDLRDWILHWAVIRARTWPPA